MFLTFHVLHYRTNRAEEAFRRDNACELYVLRWSEPRT